MLIAGVELRNNDWIEIQARDKKFSGQIYMEGDALYGQRLNGSIAFQFTISGLNIEYTRGDIQIRKLDVFPVKIITIAEVNAPSELYEALTDYTNSVYAEESSDYVLGISRSDIEAWEAGEDTPPSATLAILKFKDTVKLLPPNITEIRVR